MGDVEWLLGWIGRLTGISNAGLGAAMLLLFVLVQATVIFYFVDAVFFRADRIAKRERRARHERRLHALLAEADAESRPPAATEPGRRSGSFGAPR